MGMKQAGRPKVGLLITALLKDDWNKTGYLREKAQASVQNFERVLDGFANIVCPGLVESEEQAAAADRLFQAENVDAVVFT